MRCAALLLFLFACANGGPNGAGPTQNDAKTPDGEVDPTGDGPPPEKPVMCGGSICVAGQTCDSGACTFGCAGTKVPGDYADLQTAIDALAAVGADATICVGAATLSGSQLYIRDQMNHNKSLTIIGESIDKSQIQSEIYVNTGWNKVLIKGVHVNPGANRTAVRANIGPGNKLTVVASKLTGTYGIQISNAADVLLDGTEITTTTGYGVYTYASSGQLTARVENSYFHGTGYAVYSSTSGGSIMLQFVGNTVMTTDSGLDLNGSTTALIANSLFTGATDVSMRWANPANVTRHNNALWNNTTNYGGLAADGANYLKIDCMLDTSPRIPTLKTGSPCGNAGDKSVSSTHDFHGTARGAMPDLGAVESP